MKFDKGFELQCPSLHEYSKTKLSAAIKYPINNLILVFELLKWIKSTSRSNIPEEVNVSTVAQIKTTSF